ncbi:MAG: hypothetical protein RIB71_15250 [Imperialibacter sp.]|uniref:hypothetical protein n=1 Tax=Imperialibacter sp. TaxID=2038411 RepID=UPI0032EC315D
MNYTLRKAVETKNEQALIESLDLSRQKTVDPTQYELIEEALLGTWHSQHEDLVNMIYLENLKDDRFINPILKIALDGDVFRPYDDELESTLRKCVHALKTIDSVKANLALIKLESLNNDNVKTTLDMYKK